MSQYRIRDVQGWPEIRRLVELAREHGCCGVIDGSVLTGRGDVLVTGARSAVDAFRAVLEGAAAPRGVSC